MPLQFVHQLPDHDWQAGEKLIKNRDPGATIHFSAVKCIGDLLEQYEQMTQVLYGWFFNLLRRFPEDQGGRRKDWALHFFILQLKEIWEKGTGKKAGRSRNPHTLLEVGGPFVRFVRLCLTYQDPGRTYSSLGDTIDKVLQNETAIRNRKNLSK